MVPMKKIIPMDCNIFLIGDDHEGTIQRHDDGWEQMVDMVNSDYEGLDCDHNFVVDHGDVIDGITPDDPRYDEFTAKGKILHQIDRAEEHRLRIADRMVTILDGNHPMKLKNFGPITEMICKRLHVPYGSWSAHITYVTKRGKALFKHFATHGSFTLRSSIDDPEDRENSLKKSLRKKLDRKMGDCVVMSAGHSHRLLVKAPKDDLFISCNGSKLKQNYTDIDDMDISGNGYIDESRRWYVNTGSFYKLYCEGGSSYAERANYDPLELGFAIMVVRNGRPVEIRKIVLS
jgi:hypothetical protein